MHISLFDIICHKRYYYNYYLSLFLLCRMATSEEIIRAYEMLDEEDFLLVLLLDETNIPAHLKWAKLSLDSATDTRVSHYV